jgi:hypothetical protein
MTYNCARVHVGGYVGGGTNENEQWIECKYRVISGEITTKRLRPIRVKGTNSEGTMFRLDTFVLYPQSETVTVSITNGKRNFHIELVKRHDSHNAIFKLRL